MESGYSLSDVAAVTRNNDYNDGFGFGGGFLWIIAIIAILPMIMGGGFWGNNRNDEPVTESGLCNAMNFNNLENAVGRQADQLNNVYTGLQNGLCNIGYETLRNFNTTQMQIAQGDNELQRQISECCCTTQRAIDATNYNNALNTASINANTTAGIQKILDQMCADKAAAQAARIQQLELNQALCGVVRYPTQTTYGAGYNPFFNNGCCCGTGNI